MLDRACRAAPCIVIALAVAIAFVLSPVAASPSHNPVASAAMEAERHTELAAEFVGSGHVHENGTEDEQVPGHTHGDDPADHSHETSGSFAASAEHVPPVARAWHLMPSAFAELEDCSRLDRPPRLVFVL